MPLHKIILVFFCLIVLINTSYVASQAGISLSVDVYPEGRIVSAGDEVILQVNLIQLLDQKRKDVVLFLSLTDANDKSLYESKQTIALETKASIVDRISMPDNIKEGNYIINIEVFDINGENLLGEASERITIENRITKEDIYLIGVYLIVAFLIIFIIMIYKHNRDFHRDHKQKITKRDIVKYIDHEED